MKKQDIAVALGLLLLPLGQPIYLGTASLFTSTVVLHSLTAKACLLYTSDAADE